MRMVDGMSSCALKTEKAVIMKSHSTRQEAIVPYSCTVRIITAESVKMSRRVQIGAKRRDATLEGKDIFDVLLETKIMKTSCNAPQGIWKGQHLQQCRVLQYSWPLRRQDAVVEPHAASREIQCA